MSRPTFLAHRASILLMAAAVIVATADGFAQSYAGLYKWAIERGLTEWKAESFPLLIDLFVLVGELGLFALALEGHRLRKAGLAWLDVALPFAIATAGWGVSLVFNVGAVGRGFAEQATAAVPPVASMLGLLVLLRTLHRLVSKAAEDGQDAADEPLVDEHAAEAHGGRPLVWWPLPDLAAEELPEPPRDGPEPDETDEGDAGGEGPYPEDDPPGTGVPDVPDELAALLTKAAEEFAEDLRRGKVPGIRPIKRRVGVGQPRAKEVQAHLAVLASK